MSKISDFEKIQASNEERLEALLEKYAQLRMDLEGCRLEYSEADDLHKPHMEIYSSLDTKLICMNLDYCRNEIIKMISF